MTAASISVARVIAFPSIPRTGLKVYIAGPYSKGDTVQNIRKATEAGDRVFGLGHIPFIPHLNYVWHMLFPKPHADWMRWDLEWLRECDVLIRLPGESEGAEQEVEYAQTHGIPVYTLEEFCNQ